MKPARHVFVCQNDRPQGGKPSCAARGAGDVLSALQECIGRCPDLWGAVAVTSTACLGPCFSGPALVVYPEGVWYGGVTPADAAEIADSHLVRGRPVVRLLYTWPAD